MLQISTIYFFLIFSWVIVLTILWYELLLGIILQKYYKVMRSQSLYKKINIEWNNKLFYTEIENDYKFLYKENLYDIREFISYNLFKDNEFSYQFFKKFIEYRNNFIKKDDKYTSIIKEIMNDELYSRIYSTSKLFDNSYESLKKYKYFDESKESIFFIFDKKYTNLIKLQKLELIKRQRSLNELKFLGKNNTYYNYKKILNSDIKEFNNFIEELLENLKNENIWHSQYNMHLREEKEKNCSKMFFLIEPIYIKIKENFDKYLEYWDDDKKKIFDKINYYYMRIWLNFSIISQNKIFILMELLKELQPINISLNIDEDGWWKNSLKLVRDENIKKKIENYESIIDYLQSSMEMYFTFKNNLIIKIDKEYEMILLKK